MHAPSIACILCPTPRCINGSQPLSAKAGRTEDMLDTKIWQIYDNVAHTACLHKHTDIAERMFNAALETCGYKKSLHRQRLQSLAGLADTYFAQGRKSESLKLYNRVINLMVRLSDKTEREQSLLAHCFSKVGELRSSMGQIEEALQFHKRSVRLLDKLPGSSQSFLSSNLLRISYLSSLVGKTSEADFALIRVRALQSSTISNSI